MTFEIVDRCHPTDRGMRFSTLDRALIELRQAVPLRRFYVHDRTTGLCYRANGTTINAWCYPAEASPQPREAFV